MCSWFVGCALCAVYACSFTTMLMHKEKAAMTFLVIKSLASVSTTCLIFFFIFSLSQPELLLSQRGKYCLNIFSIYEILVT